MGVLINNNSMPLVNNDYFQEFLPLPLIVYHSVPAIHTEEYAPQMIPAINGRANSLIEVTPIKYNTKIVINVVIVVLMLLLNVWDILTLTISAKSDFCIARRFSRIRSKITIVALIE